MTHSSSNTIAGFRAGMRWALGWMFMLLLATGSWAQGGANSGSGADGTNASSPGDEVTSLPMLNDAPGLTLVGGLRELRGVVVAVHGRGQLLVTRLDRRTFAVTFAGDFRVELDRATLNRTTVGALFHGGAPFRGGVAMLQVGASAPVLLPADRVPLPIARLASSPRAQGQLVTLDAVGNHLHRAHVEADFRLDRVVLQQVLH